MKTAKKRLHHNVLAIALANKLARIAWSVLAHGRSFEASKFAEGPPSPLDRSTHDEEHAMM
jgi:transposase